MSIAIIAFLVRVYITSESAYFVCVIAFLSMIGWFLVLVDESDEQLYR